MRNGLLIWTQAALVAALALAGLSGCSQLAKGLQPQPDDGTNRFWGDYVAEYEGAGISGAIALSGWWGGDLVLRMEMVGGFRQYRYVVCSGGVSSTTPGTTALAWGATGPLVYLSSVTPAIGVRG